MRGVAVGTCVLSHPSASTSVTVVVTDSNPLMVVSLSARAIVEGTVSSVAVSGGDDGMTMTARIGQPVMDREGQRAMVVAAVQLSDGSTTYVTLLLIFTLSLHY